MGSAEDSRIPYNERTDDQKLESNWRKAQGLYKRKDWSAAIVRAATSAEIAANIYVRHYLITEHNLPLAYVGALLLSANGLDGKFKRLIRPAALIKGTWQQLRAVQKEIETLHEHRNSIVHAGQFKNRREAKEAFKSSLIIIRMLASAEAIKIALPFRR